MPTRNGTHKPDVDAIQQLPLARIVPSPFQPRKTFAAAELEQMAATIRVAGVQVPIIVRVVPAQRGWELIDGERRCRASELAGLTKVPARVVEMTDAQVIRAQLIIDADRVGLSELERSEAMQRAVDEGATVEEIAAGISRSISTVRALLRLRDAPELARQAYRDGVIPAETLKAIARVPGAKQRDGVARLVLWGQRDWTAGVDDPPTDKDLARVGNVEPLTYRATRELIAGSCTVQLKDAPFSRKSIELLPEAGSCDACPKRAGNMDDPEWADVRADVCSDVACYRAKLAAHNALAIEAAEDSGRPVLSGDAAKPLFPYAHDPGTMASPEWIDLAQVFHDAETSKPYEQLLAKPLAAEITVAVDPAGGVHRLVRTASAHAELKRQGIRVGPVTSAAEKRRARERNEDALKAKALKESARIANGRVADDMAAAADGQSIDGRLRAIVGALADALGRDVCRQVLARKDADDIGNVAAVLQVPELLGLIAELVAARKSSDWGPHHTIEAQELEFWRAFGVDPAACQREAAKPQAETKPAWQNQGVALMGLTTKTLAVLTKAKVKTAGEAEDWLLLVRGEKHSSKAAADEVRRALEILRSDASDRPRATERVLKRQAAEMEGANA